MDALGIFLFVIVAWAWAWPESLGRWLRDVRSGYNQPS
jgi:hypothetical protein